MAKKDQRPLDLSGLLRLYRGLQPLKKVVFWTLGATVLLGLGYLAFSLAYLGKVYPNVQIGSTLFSGQTESEVRAKLTELNKFNQDNPIHLTYEDQNISLVPDEASWQLDIDQTTKNIIGYGRSQKWWIAFGEQLKAPFLKIKITPVTSYDAQLLDQQITTFSEIVDNPAQDATARYVDERLTVTREQVGKRINRQEAIDLVVSQWTEFKPGTINLEMRFDTPKVVLGSTEELEAQAEQLSQAKLDLTWDGGKKSLSTKEIKQLVGFIGRQPETPIIDNNVPQQILTAAFTQEQVRTFLETFDDSINQPAKDPKLVIKDGALSVAEVSHEGKIVDLEASAKTIFEALTADPRLASAQLTLKKELPIITENRLSELGIKERIGYGETSMGGSPANRRHNIANGISLLSSALVKPGDEFSTVKTLGAVDDTTGFLPELVIKENRTTPEFGGGLCQVSTTLFRSVLNAGLKVTERQNHSYRVSYYEPPVGLDATIYLPRPDFKFLNDTPGYILVQGRVSGNKVVFELWGTGDGRTSAVSTPIVSNVVPAGDPVYADTDTLFKGETKQIEKAHDGATAIAYYTVTRNGQVINKQTFKSVYKAWPARFLVGTKELPAPPPTDTPPPPTP